MPHCLPVTNRNIGYLKQIVETQMSNIAHLGDVGPGSNTMITVAQVAVVSQVVFVRIAT